MVFAAHLLGVCVCLQDTFKVAKSGRDPPSPKPHPIPILWGNFLLPWPEEHLSLSLGRAGTGVILNVISECVI